MCGRWRETTSHQFSGGVEEGGGQKTDQKPRVRGPYGEIRGSQVRRALFSNEE